MAEVGLLPFARVALEVATQVLPPYRTRFSKHQFTQPQLLAVLCLMRYEDWTFREAENALARAPRVARRIEIARGTDYTTLYRFLRRLDDVTVERGLGETVRRLRRRRRRAVSVAIDGTGLSYNSVSTFFIRRLEQHADRSARHRHWLKWVIVVDVQQQILLAQRAHQGPGSDVRSLPDCWTWRHEVRAFGWCWRMQSSTRNPTTNTSDNAWEPKASSPPSAEVFPKAPFGIKCSAPFRKTVPPTRQDRNHLLGDQTQAFSRAPGRSLSIQIRQALLLGLAYNLYRLRHPLIWEDVNRASVDSKGT